MNQSLILAGILFGLGFDRSMCAILATVSSWIQGPFHFCQHTHSLWVSFPLMTCVYMVEGGVCSRYLMKNWAQKASSCSLHVGQLWTPVLILRTQIFHQQPYCWIQMWSHELCGLLDLWDFYLHEFPTWGADELSKGRASLKQSN